ncbi:hypothetical protein [Gandjariella thermophila]|uniref:Uncharacterized protein n=1 Tax=Gandjariella thermophila TaxID=1931992 RepID=A0A4D4JFX7_9PSEU|nr:hypothetical protein [Gandjariella thermophila]GDY33306.1 hypothetical protein GTS_49390 [Gandjariella thermophila]
MVDFTQLQNLNPSGLEQAADQWLSIHRKIEEAMAAFEDKVTRPLDEGIWQGDAGAAAKRYCDAVTGDIEDVAKEVESLSSFLDEIVNGSAEVASLRKNQQRIFDLHRQAVEQGMTVDSDGSVRWAVIRNPGPLSDEERKREEQAARTASELERQIKDELREATETDHTLANSLKVIFGTPHNFESEDRQYGDHDETLYDAMLDLETEAKLRSVELDLRHQKHWTDAADLLQHWLDGRGTPVDLNPEQMLNDIPAFKADAGRTLDEVRAMPDGTFTTNWKTTAPNVTDGDRSLNWFYALNHFQYRLVGEKTGGTITYHVEVQKRYDWGIPSEHRSSLDRPPIYLEQADIAHLNSVGKAKEFDVRGTSGKMTAPA